MSSRKEYYSARANTHVSKSKLELPALQELFLGTYNNFVGRCYFQEALGYECVDAGFVSGSLQGNVELYFYRKLKKQNLWPIDEFIANYDKIDLFDVIELLYDLVSKPVDGHYHSWNGCGWHYNSFDKESGQQEFRTEINEILEGFEEGYELSEMGQVVSKNSFSPGSRQNNHTALVQLPVGFDAQFRHGLPVSLSKPIGTIEAGQNFKFEENENVGVLQGDIYPNFCFADLASWVEPGIRLSKYTKPQIRYDTWQHISWTVLHNLCQTDTERAFLQAYVQKFVICYKQPDKSMQKYVLSWEELKDKVPALIPQAWINWSSTNKEALRRIGYTVSNLPYRLDFVAFWQSKNFVVLIDGIEHYAELVGKRWDAKEEKYAARLKEDRLLRIQGWNVFRVGNWEVKDSERLEQVLSELQLFIGFDAPPTPPLVIKDEEVPF